MYPIKIGPFKFLDVYESYREMVRLVSEEQASCLNQEHVDGRLETYLTTPGLGELALWHFI